ncbi:uncharacterized protein RAG0_00734 [Rhynchosporium agropyri]|uniref:Uncharacterized protein n=1 Tax=Rhynchosporium agropyri TaxID=914238 RepID=A0A1E1JUC8_9HELO|nr:uncharacterized protein RAG0_00734 [Rhynchosporium agropyri]
MAQYRDLGTGSSVNSSLAAEPNLVSVSHSNSNSSDSESDSKSKTGSNSEPDSEPETEQLSQRRQDLRWLHAGLFKDVRGFTQDVWYAFKLTRRGRRKIIYASNSRGKSFGNLNAGRWKIDMITWDKHHADKWARFITARGTWAFGNVMKGRAHQRMSVLQTWLDPSSPDVFPNGKTGNRTLEPPRNVIHSINDSSPGGHAPTANRVPYPPRNRNLDPSECYPRTEIPYSTFGIVVEAFKNTNQDPLIVIADFLTSQMACNPKFKSRRVDQNNQIESAFYECGWRINRRALERANDDMASGKIENAFESKHWRHSPPLWVDRFKGKKLKRMLEEMRKDMAGDHQDSEDESESDSESDSDNDSDSDSPDLSTSSRRLSHGSNAEDGSSEVGDNSLFLPNTSGPSRPQKSKSQRGGTTTSGVRYGRNIEQELIERLTGAMEYSEDELEYLPDDSSEKGKGPAKTKQIAPQGLNSRLPSADRLKSVKRRFHFEKENENGHAASLLDTAQYSKMPGYMRLTTSVEEDSQNAEGFLESGVTAWNCAEQNASEETGEREIRKTTKGLKKRFAENTSDEDDKEDVVVITKPTSTHTPLKRSKSEEPRPEPVKKPVVSWIDSDSDFEIIESKSTPVGVKTENRRDRLPAHDEDSLGPSQSESLMRERPSHLLSPTESPRL